MEGVSLQEHVHSSAQLTLLQQPVSAVKWLVERLPWKHLDKSHRGDQRVMIESNALVNSRPLLNRGRERDRGRELFCWHEEAKFAPGEVNWTHRSSDIWAGRIFHCRLSTLSLRGYLGVSKSVTCARSAFSIKPLLITLKPLTWPPQLGIAESAEVLWTLDVQFGMLSQQILILISSLHILFQKAGVGCSLLISEW